MMKGHLFTCADCGATHTERTRLSRAAAKTLTTQDGWSHLDGVARCPRCTVSLVYRQARRIGRMASQVADIITPTLKVHDDHPISRH